MPELDWMKCVEEGRGLTHGGSFHADDVFSTALLRRFNPDFEPVRAFEVPEGYDGIAYDIGGGRFDHHQPDAEVRPNGVKYAAFGLLWREFGHEVLPDPDDWESFDETFVQVIDKGDNGVEHNDIAGLVSDFVPTRGSSADYDAAFMDAVEMAEGMLDRRFGRILEARQAVTDLRADMEAQQGEAVLVLSEYVPGWQKEVVGSGFEYVTFPSNRGGQTLQGVPDAVGSFDVVAPFPEEWRGLSGVDLECASGIDGLTFCHATGFLCACDTPETALVAADASLSWAHAPEMDASEAYGFDDGGFDDARVASGERFIG